MAVWGTPGTLRRPFSSLCSQRLLFLHIISRLLGEPLVVLSGPAHPSSLPFWSLILCSCYPHCAPIRPQYRENLKSLERYSHTAYWRLLSQPSSSSWLWNSIECLLVPLLRNVHVHILLMDNWLCVWWNTGSAKGKWRKGTFENKGIRQN